MTTYSMGHCWHGSCEMNHWFCQHPTSQLDNSQVFTCTFSAALKSVDAVFGQKVSLHQYMCVGHLNLACCDRAAVPRRETKAIAVQMMPCLIATSLEQVVGKELCSNLFFSSPGSPSFLVGWMVAAEPLIGSDGKLLHIVVSCRTEHVISSSPLGGTSSSPPELRPGEYT